jgi:hypothetical protein
MNKDQKLLEEAYQSIYESTLEPLYFGPLDKKEAFMKWLSNLPHEVHEDGSVSVDGHASIPDDFSKTKMERVPFNFREVRGDFDCCKLGLTSLNGSPRIVTRSFDCQENKLTSLKGAPEVVGRDFQCRLNELTSLKGAPKEVGNSFYCHYNKLTSLEGAPEVIKRNFVSDEFTDEDYRKFVKMRKYIEGNLDKDLDADLGDFE